MVIARKDTLLMLVNFGAVGIAATMTYFILAVGLQATLIPNPIIASITAYGFSAILSYFGHQFLTFRSGQLHSVGMPRFVVTASFGFFLVWLIPKLFDEYMHLAPVIAYGFISVAIPILNFFILRFWVFSSSQ